MLTSFQTTAIGSLLVGSIVTRIEEHRPKEFEPAEIATTVSLLAGFILLFIGFARLGWIVDFIPYISISAFITAAAITIISTQFSVLMGIKNINTREAPYLVILNTIKGLPDARLDAAIGLSSLVLLVITRECCGRMEKRYAAHARLWGIISSMRFAITIILFTLVGWLVSRSREDPEPAFRLVGKIESGMMVQVLISAVQERWLTT
jgi:sodium-independent sulfate anion transporter 11